MRPPGRPSAASPRETLAVFVLIGLTGVILAACGTDQTAGPGSTRPAGEEPGAYAFPDPRELPPHPYPPDPLALFETGRSVRTPAEWRRKRRPELRALFEHYVYGRAPGPPAGETATVVESDTEAMDGRATRRQVDIRLGPEGAPVLHLLLYVPNEPTGPAPTLLGLNFYGNHTVTHDPAVPLSDGWIPERGEGVVDHRATEASRGTSVDRWPLERAVERGYAVATAYHGDVDPDVNDFSNGIHPLYYEAGQERPGPAEWGTVAAWAWGLSRAMDYLETDPRVSWNRVAVFGHSRNGKAALLAAALDERFAAVLSNQSGCTGAALSRRRRGETLLLINLRFPHWFCSHYHAFNEREPYLPVDQHLLVALAAPRPALILSAAGDLWSDPEGEFLAARAADPVYRLLGAPGLDADWPPPLDTIVGERLAYHLRGGGHSVGREDWDTFLDFCDRTLPRTRKTGLTKHEN